jgi:hypothetical protein
MKLTKTAGVLLAVLLVATAGVAALPGNAPADSQAGQADDNYDDGANASDAPADAGPEMNDSETDEENAENAENADDRRGPPTDMPAQVPDHVSQIHELIHQYLDGDIDNLGERISDVMGSEDAADEQADEDAEDSEEMEEDADDEEMDEDADDVDEDDADDEEEMDDDADDDSEEDDEMDDDATATPA